MAASRTQYSIHGLHSLRKTIKRNHQKKRGRWMGFRVTPGDDHARIDIMNGQE
jgi:hypothetical protein